MGYSTEDVIRLVRENNVKCIQLWFTDILGMLKSFSLPASELEKALIKGVNFDGSLMGGSTPIEENELIALPDPNTITVLPWQSQGHRIAGLFCDINNPDGTPFEGDPRYVLKRMLSKIAQDGYKLLIGTEVEFCYFKSSSNAEIIDRAGYFDLLPLDNTSEIHESTMLMLEEIGIHVKYSHHEASPGQHEIDLHQTEALTMADNVMLLKYIIKKVAHERGIYASFMPKPMYGYKGNGMHVHQSLIKGRKNAFFDSNDTFLLSDVAKKYIAGTLLHSPDITIVLNQWVNSYKRLVPGFEAPEYVTWAQKNPSTLVRIPELQAGSESALSVEVRSPDSACNPYLTFAVLLAAGLNGIEENTTLPESVNSNIDRMTYEERREAGIITLPQDIHEAIALAEKSELLKNTLGEYVFNKLLRNKRIIWDEFRSLVTAHEIKKYLPIL